MNPNNPCLVYITVANELDGKNLAKLALQKKLIACANLYPEVIFPGAWRAWGT